MENGAPSCAASGVPSSAISVGFWMVTSVCPESSRSIVTFQAGSSGLGNGSTTDIPDGRSQGVLKRGLMALVYCRRRTRVRIRTQTTVLYRNME